VRALLSVSDKTGLIALARGLQELGWELIATDGTRAALAADFLVRYHGDCCKLVGHHREYAPLRRGCDRRRLRLRGRRTIAAGNRACDARGRS